MQLYNGVTLEFINTDKFKDIGISVRFLSTLEKRKAAARSLLALMMCDRVEKYPTKQSMSEKQDELYGATLSSQTAGYGQAQVIEIRSKMINPSYLAQESTLLEDVFLFLKEVIFHPLLEESVFLESQSMLCAKIERAQDDPAQFAVSEGLKAAGANTCLGVSALGELADVKSLTLQDIQKTYEEMIKEDCISILICGDIDEKKMKAMATSTFAFDPRDTKIKTYYTVKNDLTNEYKEVYKKISQSYIMMTLFTNTSVTEDDFYVLRVANAMLGQYSTSMLFQEVREKNSLCYSIYSNLIAYDGALGITTGIEKENIQKTLDLINLQIQRLKDGDFEDGLLEVSKHMIVNSLKAGKDNMNSLIALTYQNQLLDRNYQTEDLIAKINNVTRDDVLLAMKKCEQKMTFVLTKEEEHEEDN